MNGEELIYLYIHKNIIRESLKSYNFLLNLIGIFIKNMNILIDINKMLLTYIS